MRCERAGNQTASIPVLRAHLRGLKIGTGHLLCAFTIKRTVVARYLWWSRKVLTCRYRLWDALARSGRQRHGRSAQAAAPPSTLLSRQSARDSHELLIDRG
eukprot:6182154-Pleurochrysis_carterae.AAC.6